MSGVKHHTFGGTGLPNQVGVIISPTPNTPEEEEEYGPSYVLSADHQAIVAERDAAQLDAMRLRQTLAVCKLITEERNVLRDKCRRYRALLKMKGAKP